VLLFDVAVAFIDLQDSVEARALGGSPAVDLKYLSKILRFRDMRLRVVSLLAFIAFMMYILDNVYGEERD
jgi:hypothetical protein